jgi:hypothetical protein
MHRRRGAASGGTGGEFLPATEIYRDGTLKVPRKHATMAQLARHRLVTPELRREVLVSTTVRNPFDSLVSLDVKNATWYQELARTPGSFIAKRKDRQAAVRFCATHTFNDGVDCGTIPSDIGVGGWAGRSSPVGLRPFGPGTRARSDAVGIA